jgi:hypothetical protein
MFNVTENTILLSDRLHTIDSLARMGFQIPDSMLLRFQHQSDPNISAQIDFDHISIDNTTVIPLRLSHPVNIKRDCIPLLPEHNASAIFVLSRLYSSTEDSPKDRVSMMATFVWEGNVRIVIYTLAIDMDESVSLVSGLLL